MNPSTKITAAAIQKIGRRLSSTYGMRKHPISGFNKMHKGIDFAAPKGTPVYAGGNGVIERAGRNASKPEVLETARRANARAPSPRAR